MIKLGLMMLLWLASVRATTSEYLDVVEEFATQQEVLEKLSVAREWQGKEVSARLRDWASSNLEARTEYVTSLRRNLIRTVPGFASRLASTEKGLVVSTLESIKRLIIHNTNSRLASQIVEGMRTSNERSKKSFPSWVNLVAERRRRAQEAAKRDAAERLRQQVRKQRAESASLEEFLSHEARVV